MTEHKYTDEEVIKALECCASHLYACEDCHYLGKCRLLEKDAIDLINRQKAEVAFWMDAAANAKKEAVKEFAEKLKGIYINDKRYDRPNAHTMLIKLFANIDDLVKEFTEEKT
jgi:hypothetical protein